MKLNFLHLPLNQNQVDAAEAFALALSAAPLEPQHGDVVVLHGSLMDYYAEVISTSPKTGRGKFWMYDPIFKGGGWYEQHFDLDKTDVLIPGGALSVWALYPEAQ